MEKLFKVRAVYMFEMSYIVKAQDEKEAAWMVSNLDSHGNIEGFEYDQRGLGTVVQKVKEVSEKKAKELIAEANYFTEEQMQRSDLLEGYTLQYKDEDEEEVDLLDPEPNLDDEWDKMGKM